MIYLDNAATSLHKPETVAAAVYQTLVSGSVGNAARGSNEASLQALRLAVETRGLLGELFGYPHPNQAAFSMNATDSLNMAIQGLFEPGDHVITTQMEHNSVLRPLYRKEKRGWISRSSPAMKRKNVPGCAGGQYAAGYQSPWSAPMRQI